MPNYKIYNFNIASDEMLFDLIDHDEKKPDIFIRRAFSREIFQPPSRWFMNWHLPDGDLWLSFAKIGEGFLLRFNRVADFFVNYKGDEIIWSPLSEIPTETIHHLLLDQVIPMVINLKGREALHASAVLLPNGIIGFVGSAYSGKSTLTGSFLTAGCPLVSDDCLALLEKDREIYAIPAYPGLRLWEDARTYLFSDDGDFKSVAHYTKKFRIDIERKPSIYCGKPKPLRRLYEIVNTSESREKTDISIEKLSPTDSFMALIRYAFRLDITDRHMLTRQFYFLKQVASKISVRVTTFPRDFRFLPAVREAILKDLKDLEN